MAGVKIADLILQLNSNTKGLTEAVKAISNVSKKMDESTRKITSAATKIEKGYTNVGTAAKKTAAKQNTEAEKVNKTIAKQISMFGKLEEKAKAVMFKGKQAGAPGTLFGGLQGSLQAQGKALTGGALDPKDYARRVNALQSSINNADRSLTQYKSTASSSVKQTDKLQGTLGLLGRNFAGIGKPASDFNNTLRNLGSTAVLAAGPLSGIGSRIIAMLSIMQRGTGVIAAFVGALVGLGALAVKTIAAGSRLESSLSTLNARIQASGRSAEFSAEGINEMSKALGEATLTSATAARQAATLLLSFKSITSPQLMGAVLNLAQDLSQTFGKDLKRTTRDLGKALEDPIRGLNLLREFGIRYTEEQRRQIKVMVDSGRKMEAMKIILEGVNKIVGGNAVAAAKGLTGAMDTLGERFQQFFEDASSSTGILAPVTESFNLLSDKLKELSESNGVGGLLKSMKALVNGFTTVFNVLVSNIDIVIAALLGLFGASMIANIVRWTSVMVASLSTVIPALAGFAATFAGLMPVIAAVIAVVGVVGSVLLAFSNRTEDTTHNLDRLRAEWNAGKASSKEFGNSLKTVEQQMRDQAQAARENAIELRKLARSELFDKIVDLNNDSSFSDLFKGLADVNSRLRAMQLEFFKTRDASAILEKALEVQSVMGSTENLEKFIELLREYQRTSQEIKDKQAQDIADPFGNIIANTEDIKSSIAGLVKENLSYLNSLRDMKDGQESLSNAMELLTNPATKNKEEVKELRRELEETFGVPAEDLIRELEKAIDPVQALEDKIKRLREESQRTIDKLGQGAKAAFIEKGVAKELDALREKFGGLTEDFKRAVDELQPEIDKLKKDLGDAFDAEALFKAGNSMRDIEDSLRSQADNFGLTARQQAAVNSELQVTRALWRAAQQDQEVFNMLQEQYKDRMEEIKRLAVEAFDAQAQRKIVKNLQQMNVQFEDQERNLYNNQIAQAGVNARLQIMRNIMQSVGGDSVAFQKAMQDNAAAIDEIAQRAEDLARKAMFAETLKSAANEIGSFFVNAFMGVESSFKNFIKNITRIVLEFLVQMIVVNSILTALSSIFGPAGAFGGGGRGSTGGNSIGGSVGGNVPTIGQMSGRPLNAAQGGVIQRPSQISSGSQSGKIAENGPEAVLPLSRTPGGGLGVMASGGGGSKVVVNVYNQGNIEVSTAQRTDNAGNTNIDLIIKEKVRSMVGSGDLDPTFNQRFGVKPVLGGR